MFPNPYRLCLESQGQWLQDYCHRPANYAHSKNSRFVPPVRPGRDSALAHGILHVLIENGWIDESFIEAHTQGFGKVKDLVKAYTPERTQSITGVPAKSITECARLWHEAGDSMLIHARALSTTPRE